MRSNPSFLIKMKLGLVCSLLFMFLLGCHAKQYVAPELIKDSLVFIYPPEARNKHLEGTVLLRIQIDEKGDVLEAMVTKSSGYDILDQTALNVANVARFKPARMKGKSRSVWIAWPLIFEITAMKFIPEEWIQQVTNYQLDATSDNPTKKMLAQQAIYYHYKDFATNMVENRSLSLNETALSVVLPEVRRQWQDYENNWPLTFVLFQDYIQRYPDSQFCREAEDYLLEYIKNEIFQLKVRGFSESLSQKVRDRFIQSLVSYLQQKFPKKVTEDLLKNYPRN